MNPTRSERKSRRSSILKPPKPRQPLQNVELNVSIVENSPATTTAKVRRRVSFAEKKHVKEFCDSMDQGTVWDNTYEESELSQMKNSQNSNNDENIVSHEGVNQLPKIHTEIDTRSIGEPEINDPNLSRENPQISIVTESAVSIIQDVNTENTKVFVDGYLSTVERDFNLGDSMGGLAHIKPSEIPLPPNYSGSPNARRSLSVTATTIASGFQNSTNFVSSRMQDDDYNEVPMDETLIGDISLEPTMPTSLTLSKGRPILRASFNMIPNIDFLKNDPISSHLPLRKVSTESKENIRADDRENPKDASDATESNEGDTTCPEYQDRIAVYHDTSMEMTESLPNRMSIFSKHDQPNKLGDTRSNIESFLVTEQKTTFQIKTAETVTKILGLSSTGLKEFDQNVMDLQPERIPIFHKKCMELGEVVLNVSSAQQLQKVPPERATVLCNKAEDFSEIVQNIRSTDKEDKTALERTTIFHDESVDCTEIVQNVPSTNQLQKLPPERTTIFHDEFIECTEVVQNVPNTEKPQWASQERTTLFHNKSLDFTDVVRSTSSSENPQKRSPEKTRIFLNQSVDMTDVIRRSPSYENLKEPSPEKTTIFQNQSVDMTEVLRSNPAIDRPQMPILEKTMIFHDKSIDTTEIIPIPSSIQNPIQQVLEHEMSPSRLERTSDSHNTVVGVTNVEIGKINEQSENQSLELTEAVSRVLSVSNQLSKDFCTLAVGRMPKHKPLDLEAANPLSASIVEKNPDPEIRSPVAKRIKSLGSRKSIDVTAAVPFVECRKLARQQCDGVNVTNCKPPSAEVNSRTPSMTEDFGNKSMDMTDVAVASSNVDPPRTFFVKPVESVRQQAQDETTNSHNKSMLTEAISCLYRFEPTSQKCTNSTSDNGWQQPRDNIICHDDSMEITRAIPSILKAKATIFHDESMELTRAALRHRTAQISPVTDESSGGAVNRQCYALSASESKTVVFRNDLMELTSGVQLSSQPIERNRMDVKKKGNPWSNDITEFEKDGKTMVYGDDPMELTRGVPFPSRTQTEALDKENCPLSMEDVQSLSSRRSGNKDSVGVSKNDRLELMKSTSFLSSKNDNEHRAEPIESENESADTESEIITGVVPFAMEIEDENRDGRDLERVGSTMGVVSEKMEMTEGVRWSSGQPQLPEMETFLPVDKTVHRQSHVAKELFRKPVLSEKGKTGDENPTDSSETADLDAEIRKLAESFAVSYSVDESGFDQATFLRQQARCMKDYEANSTASQEYHSGEFSARKNASFIEKRDSPNSGKSNGPKDSVGNEELAPPIDSLVISSNSTASTSVREKGNSIAENNCSSRIDRGLYDRSLEELRCRAYSVSKFRPEETGFELTAAISMADRGNPHHESIFDQQPPSFFFADTITTDSIIERAASVDELPTESNSSIGGGKVQAQKSPETRRVSVHDFAETSEHLCNDKSEVEEITDIAKETMTLKAHANKGPSDSKSESTADRSKRKHRSQTSVIKWPNPDETTLLPSSPETNKEMKNDRLSGVTTAAEFSSESPNGPNEKIRRRENGLATEETSLSTVDKEGNAAELIATGGWGNRNFANSTVIGDDFTRQFVHQGIEETSVVLETPFSDELLSEIVQNDRRTVNQWSEVAAANEMTMELEFSVPKSPFLVLKETVKSLAESAETIWSINRLDERIVAFNFFSKSIVLAIYLNDNANSNSMDSIKAIGLLSQLVEEKTDPGVCLAHRLIMKKVNSESLTHSYRTYEDVPRLLEYVSAEVKLGMDFMFELDRLRNRTIMDIHGNRITFMVRTRDINAGIILNITMEIKPFEDISSNDITVAYVLGGEKVRENDIKRLITNVKRDHRFLRFYINDVRDYIDLMAETGCFIRIGAE